MGLHLWFIQMGLASTFLGVVLVHLTFCLPYSVFVLWGVFSNYNPDYEAQARSLGASSWKVITRVMLPLTFPGIMVAGLFSFLLSWSQYLSTLIIGGGKVMTLPILLFALMGSGDRPVAAAVSIVFVVPAFLALLFSARYLGGKSITGIR
jgi:putative spermidine/putrescine transport system permease protein